jgi:fimbrial chaperone protein
MKKSLQIFAVFFFLLFGFVPQLWSFSFSPISQSFAPSGRGSTQTFRLKNDGDSFIAVRIKILTRSVSPDGKEENQLADELFTIYPAQVVVQPYTNQTVRIKWDGPTDIEKEQCFRVLVEQLPVQFKEDSSSGSNLKIMFRYLGALYITPEGASPDVIVDEHAVETDASGSRMLNFTLYNRGTRHSILNNLSLNIISDRPSNEGPYVIGSDQLEGISGENILPESRRTFSISLPKELKGDDFQVEIEYEPQS